MQQDRVEFISSIETTETATFEDIIIHGFSQIMALYGLLSDQYSIDNIKAANVSAETNATFELTASSDVAGRLYKYLENKVVSIYGKSYLLMVIPIGHSSVSIEMIELKN